jgi:hypothetical protein
MLRKKIGEEEEEEGGGGEEGYFLSLLCWNKRIF